MIGEADNDMYYHTDDSSDDEITRNDVVSSSELPFESYISTEDENEINPPPTSESDTSRTPSIIIISSESESESDDSDLLAPPAGVF